MKSPVESAGFLFYLDAEDAPQNTDRLLQKGEFYGTSRSRS
jgi:hypothetical protein